MLGGIHAAVASSAIFIQYIKCPSLHSVLDLVHDASVVGVGGRGVGVGRGGVNHGLRDALVVGRLGRSVERISLASSDNRRKPVNSPSNVVGLAGHNLLGLLGGALVRVRSDGLVNL